MKILFTFFTVKTKLFWTKPKFDYLIFIDKSSRYHPEITYENIVQKDMNKFQVFESECKSIKALEHVLLYLFCATELKLLLG